jgi:hypothetical protein
LNRGYLLATHPKIGPQEDADRCFIGGVPRLPRGEAIPKCELCGAEQTFYLEVEFPQDHGWAGTSLAVFACTSCSDRDRLIPEMLRGPLKGATVPRAFLAAYQRNFRFVVFSGAGEARKDYVEKVRFKRLALIPATAFRTNDSRVGGGPSWVLEDESPGSLGEGGPPFEFLLQLGLDFRFEVVKGAPRQIEVESDGKIGPASHSAYWLFLQNALYLFGAVDGSERILYALTQVD